MRFAGRDLVSITDFTNGEIEAVLDLAQEMDSALSKGRQLDLCRGKDMATLFYEPSTRTRGSFERAMHKLGGTVISFAEARAMSSAAKGETIADTIRVLRSYADVIVIRHPWEGAARVAADYAGVPVINAGDGSHEHPTQTLCDLYTLRKEKGKLKGLTVLLWGDLKYGRTVHSLIYALARLGAEVLCAPLPGLDVPSSVLRRIGAEYDYVPTRVAPEDPNSFVGEVDVFYVAPFRPYNLALWSDIDTSPCPEINIREALHRADAIYVTRVQAERQGESAASESESDYPVVNGKLLSHLKKKTLVMHPLPRVNELAYELDDYPTSVYFQQAAYGVPIRMALTALLLGASSVDLGDTGGSTNEAFYEQCSGIVGVTCPNPNCVSNHESRYVVPRLRMLKRHAGEPLTLRCAYCDHETHPTHIASSEWHQGILKYKRYYDSDSYMLDRIKPENLIIFDSEKEAQAHGFMPGKRTAKLHSDGGAR
ncbi:MAG: aspartate carbamoyltransferase [Chloroflexota bacterium]|nr:aspartate carbamoyltransferase [Chloroflexota bacterium]